MKYSIITFIVFTLFFIMSTVLFFDDDKLNFPTRLIVLGNLALWVVERVNETKNDK